MAESQPSRRTALKIAITAIVCGVVAGVGGFFAGISAVPPPKTVTKTVSKTAAATTVTVTGSPTTVTKTVTTTVTTTASPPKPTTPAKPAPEYIKIGLLAPLTGQWSYVGRHLRWGAEVAVDEINAEGGVYVAEYGKKIPLKLCLGDTKAVIEEGTSAIKKLIFVDKVDVLIGIYDTPVAAAIVPIAVENKVPIVFDGGGANLIVRSLKDFSYAFPYEIHTHDWTGSELRFLVEVVKPLVAPDRNLRVAILCEDSPFGELAMEGYTWNKKTYNLPVEFVTVVKYEKMATDFHAHMMKIKAAKPDAVIVAATPEQAAYAIEQGLRDVGLKTVYMGLPCLETPHFYELVGKFGDYVVYDSRFTPLLPYKAVAARFVEAYKKKFGELPSFMAPLTYDMVKIVCKAIEAAGSLDKKAIRDALEKMDIPADDFLAPMHNNRISWDEHHESHMDSFVIQLRWDEKAGKLKPYIVWGPPEVAKQAKFELPPYYEKLS